MLTGLLLSSGRKVAMGGSNLLHEPNRSGPPTHFQLENQVSSNHGDAIRRTSCGPGRRALPRLVVAGTAFGRRVVLHPHGGSNGDVSQVLFPSIISNLACFSVFNGAGSPNQRAKRRFMVG